MWRCYQQYFSDQEQLATAHFPYKMKAEDKVAVDAILKGNDYKFYFVAMRQQLTTMNVTVLTLYKQYVALCEPDGVRFIDFNIDADFAYCIDGLLMVDLQRLKPAKCKRYLGR